MSTINNLLNSEILEKTLIETTVESWKFSKLFSRVIGKLDAGEATRYANQLRYFLKKIEENLEMNGLKLVNVEGMQFDPGVAAAALNLGDFEPEDHLIVDQMIEPIIMGPEGLKRQGTIMLRKVQR